MLTRAQARTATIPGFHLGQYTNTDVVDVAFERQFATTDPNRDLALSPLLESILTLPELMENQGEQEPEAGPSEPGPVGYHKTK